MSATLCIVGIDHDAIEEGINRSTQRREGLQRLGVVAGDEGSVGLRHDIDERVVQGDFGSFLEQGVIDRRLDRVLDLFQDVADPLVGGGQRGGFRQRGKGTNGGQAFGNVAEALRPLADHGIDFLRRVALLAQAAGKSVVDEVGERRFGTLEAVDRSKGAACHGQQGIEGQIEIALAEHADRAQCVATQCERVAVAGRDLADAEHADQRFELVGQRDDRANLAARQAVAGEAWFVVIFDGIGDVGSQAVMLGVVAAHDALQFGEFADHVGQQVGLGQHGGLFCLQCQGVASQ